MNISQLVENPNNPRTITEKNFKKLVKSIKDFGAKMMPLRPLVVDATNTVIGGNMRLRALRQLGYDEIPDEWVRRADSLTPDEVKRFIIADNLPFGEWDMDALANDWPEGDLIDWGLDVPVTEGGDSCSIGDGPDDSDEKLITCPKCKHRFIPE